MRWNSPPPRFTDPPPEPLYLPSDPLEGLGYAWPVVGLLGVLLFWAFKK